MVSQYSSITTPSAVPPAIADSYTRLKRLHLGRKLYGDLNARMGTVDWVAEQPPELLDYLVYRMIDMASKDKP